MRKAIDNKNSNNKYSSDQQQDPNDFLFDLLNYSDMNFFKQLFHFTVSIYYFKSFTDANYLIFKLKSKKLIQCPTLNCHYVTEPITDHMQLVGSRINELESINFLDLFEPHFNENLDFKCSNCNIETKNLKVEIIYNMDNNKFLIIHLNTATNDHKFIDTKIINYNTNEIIFPNINHKFKIIAGLLHHPDNYQDTDDGAHYTSIILNRNNNNWIHINDLDYSKVNETENFIENMKNVKMLFLEKKNQ